MLFLVLIQNAVIMVMWTFQFKGKEYLCRACEAMADDGGMPKVKQVRLRIMLTESISDLMQPVGTCETYLWKMFCYVTHVKILGSKFCMQMIYNYAEKTVGVFVCKMNHF